MLLGLDHLNSAKESCLKPSLPTKKPLVTRQLFTSVAYLGYGLQSLQGIAKSPVRAFKCPYCPAEATTNGCRAIFFP